MYRLFTALLVAASASAFKLESNLAQAGASADSAGWVKDSFKNLVHN